MSATDGSSPRPARAPILPVLVAAVGAAAIGFLGGIMAQGPRDGRFGGRTKAEDGGAPVVPGAPGATGAPAPASVRDVGPSADGGSQPGRKGHPDPASHEPGRGGAPAPAGFAGAAGALAPLGDGYVLEATPDGALLVLRLEPAPTGTPPTPGAAPAGPRRLELIGAYRVRHDPARHVSEPERRTAHGYYLDDLAVESRERLERARWAFHKEAASGALDAEAGARLEARAREVLAAGDAAFLVDAVADRRYPVRRTAALVLGEAGFLAAVPALAEMLESEPGPDLVRRARAALAVLLGQNVRDAATARALHEANPPPHRLARRDAAGGAGAGAGAGPGPRPADPGGARRP